jgi:hypothetical protein
MAVVGFFPGMQWVDSKGYLSPDAQRLLQAFVLSINGEGAGATIDGIQTLTNKTISGDDNTLENIDTNSLADRTGEDNSVVTGTAGFTNTVAKWDSNGDLVEGPELVTLLTTSDAEDQYLSRNGNLEATGPVRLASYTVATVPTAADYTQGLIYVSDETGGATVAVSNGTNWVRLQDLAIIS